MRSQFDPVSPSIIIACLTEHLTAGVTGTVSGTISAAEKVPDTLSPPGLFPTYDAKPIQLAKLGNACHW
jgi:hypothetical protein